MITEPTEADRNPLPDYAQMSRNDLKKSYARYCDHVRAAKEHRKSEGYDRTWKRLRDIYRLRMNNPMHDDADSIAVAIAFSTINVIAPSVAMNHPQVTVNAKSEEQDPQATITETVVNYWWRHNNIKPDARRAVKDFLVYGHGWVKVGWRFEEREHALDDDEYEAEAQAAEDELNAAAEEAPDMAHELPTTEEVREFLPDTRMEVTEDAPFVERISPFDVFVDPEATNLEDAKWIAQRLVLPIEKVKKDERYKVGARRKLNSDGSFKWHNDENHSHVPEDAGRVTLWEYYDLVNEHVCVFAEQKDVGYLVEPTSFPYPYGHPFVMIRNYDVPDQFYPIGEIEAIEPLQDELNHTRSAMVRLRNQDIAKWLYKESAFDEGGLDALTSTEPGTAIPVTDDTPLGEAIIPLAANNASAQFYMQHSETVLGDVDRVTAINEYQRGALPEVRRTATEASIIQDSANARASEKLDTVEEFYTEISKRLVKIAQTFLTSEQTARIVGPDGAKMWFKYTADDIQGEFDFSVAAGSTQPQNETFKRQQAQQMLQMLSPYIDPSGQGGYINAKELLSHVLRDAFGIKNPEKYVQDPMQMMMQQQAMMGLPPGMEGEMPPEQAADPQLSGGPQPDGAPGQNAETPETGQPTIPPEMLAQIQQQYGLLNGMS